MIRIKDEDIIGNNTTWRQNTIENGVNENDSNYVKIEKEEEFWEEKRRTKLHMENSAFVIEKEKAKVWKLKSKFVLWNIWKRRKSLKNSFFEWQILFFVFPTWTLILGVLIVVCFVVVLVVVVVVDVFLTTSGCGEGVSL